MDTSDEWKSLWTISSVYSPPLLLTPSATNKIGRLIFIPSPQPQTHHHIFFTLPQIPPYPALSASRFLHKSSAILPSTTSSISQQLPSFDDSNPQQFLLHNSLQLLTCPGTDSTLAFFPTGPNSDQVGFVTLSVVNFRLAVNGSYGETEVLSLENGLTHRIIKISVSPLADCKYTSGDFSDTIIGYLLVCTTNSVHYFKVTIRMEHSRTVTSCLELIDHKSFKSSIVHACWSPHIPEESLVLLETADLYLFDLDTILGPTSPSQRLIGKKVKVPWKEYVDFDQGCWLSCDFSWHPRILIVVHATGVFLVDSRSENYHITPLLNFGTRHVATNDKFVAFSVVGPDRFYFTLATNHMLFLCDIRKHTVPVLLWAHNIANPSYVSVSRLSDLRSLSEDVSYSWASEAGYGILLGSFWNGEFSLFCYGPRPDFSGRDSSSLYAWGLPSNIPLGTRECGCGSCLVKQDFAKDRLPVWINWQQKKNFVLGFGFLDATVSHHMFKGDNFGGFSVVTLTASGNFELHRYLALWDSSRIPDKGHAEHAFDVEDPVYYETGEDEFKFRKVFHYLKLDWLDGYLNSDLNRILSINLCKNSDNDNDITRNPSSGSDFHEHICESLKEYGRGGAHGSVNINDVFKDIYLPTSIHEIALRSIWSNLPKNVLCHGFSTYSDLPSVPASLTNVPFEFLDVPRQQPHLPPFFFRAPSSRSSKWSEKHKPSNNLVGPVTPIPFLMAYQKTLMLKADNRPVNSEIDIECDKVLSVVDNYLVGPVDPITVSLADDNEDVFHSSSNLQHLGSYKSRAMMDGSDVEDEKHNNIVFRSGQKDEEDFFDSGCHLKFRFKEQETGFGEKEKNWYKLYKRQFSDFKQKFNCYQEYLNESNINSNG
ncbi:uncharacterized protein LOC143603485 isoform X2 [Bidens hawaiensis]|uniref:uncharacterized protein LOC143603485 isoform X2 n=1 Tax=Bidens hawaiensis TaxID=980011 RepID=UPI00404B6F5A